VHWWVQTEVLRLTNIRSLQTRSAGNPGPEGSIAKLLTAELNKQVWGFALEIMGMDAALYPGGYRLARAAERDAHARSPQAQFIRSPANSVEGGTTEIMLNILAERVLGLPPDLRVDKGIPWSQVPR
jgi:alkylation response protein AidB-like acyl-CoA dehydrogenase